MMMKCVSQGGLDLNEQLELQGALCGILNNIIQKLGDGVKPHADNVSTHAVPTAARLLGDIALKMDCVVSFR